MPHSAKSSRQRTRRQRFFCRVPHIGHSVKPLPSVTSALGKKKSDVNSDGLFAECHLSGTRQRIFSFFLKILCRVPYSCTRQRNFFFFKKKSLPSAMALALGKAGKLGLCFPALPSAMVTALGKEGKMLFFWFFAFHQHKQRNHIYINTQHRIYHIHIHIPSHTHP